MMEKKLMPLLNKETTENNKRLVIEETQYSGLAFKNHWMNSKIFSVLLCRDKRYEWFSRANKKKLTCCFLLKKIAARLPFRKNFKFWLKSAVLNQGWMNSLGIRKSETKGPLDCLQPHSYMNLKYSNKKATI